MELPKLCVGATGTARRLYLMEKTLCAKTGRRDDRDPETKPEPVEVLKARARLAQNSGIDLSTDLLGNMQWLT